MPALCETMPLQKTKIYKKSITIFLWFIIPLLLILLLDFFVELKRNPDSVKCYRTWLSLMVFLVFTGLAIFFVPFYQYYYWKKYFYDIEGKNIVIRKGVLAQKEITLPFTKITDVYVDQDILDAMFGLYDVHISTPTIQSGRFAHIDGVNKEDSQKFRQLILDNINKGKG